MNKRRRKREERRSRGNKTKKMEYKMERNEAEGIKRRRWSTRWKGMNELRKRNRG